MNRVRFSGLLSRFNIRHYKYIPRWSLFTVDTKYPIQEMELDIPTLSIPQFQIDMNKLYPELGPAKIYVLTTEEENKSRSDYKKMIILQKNKFAFKYKNKKGGTNRHQLSQGKTISEGNQLSQGKTISEGNQLSQGKTINTDEKK
jgi:hypothetical protein